MTYKFTIQTSVKKKSPSLNEYLKAERIVVNRNNNRLLTKGAVMKREWDNYIAKCIRRDLRGLKITKPIVIHYDYYEPDKKRDLGNIHATIQKFTEDAMQDVGLIENDNQKVIIGFTADFHIDRLHPRIEVTIEEME